MKLYIVLFGAGLFITTVSYGQISALEASQSYPVANNTFSIENIVTISPRQVFESP